MLQPQKSSLARTSLLALNTRSLDGHLDEMEVFLQSLTLAWIVIMRQSATTGISCAFPFL